MGKNKKKCREALDIYVTEVKRLYPTARVESLPDTLGGFDVCLEVDVPRRNVIGAERRFAELDIEIYDRFGVSLLTMTGELERAA